MFRQHRKHFSSSSWVHPVLREARRRNTHEYLQVDRDHLWHPYTSVVSPSSPTLPVSHARGITLYLEKQHQEDSQELLDAMSSWWCAVWGYCHPILDAAVETQLKQMSHVMFGGLTHRPAVELSDLLRFATNNNPPSHTRQQKVMSAIFYADSGSVAVEVSLKMALQYWYGRGQPKKRRILALKGGYHGDTMGAMTVGDTFGESNHIFFEQEDTGKQQPRIFVPRPPCDSSKRIWNDSLAGWTGCMGCNCKEVGEEEALNKSLRQLEETFQEHASSLAAFIVEPLVQGAGGMRFYSSKYLQRAQQLCNEFDVLLICDEIATGFGRASGGKEAMFAFQEACIEPDILCIGKALTGGYMTLAAVMATDEVARGVSSIPPFQTKADSMNTSSTFVAALPLMHGPTFMGNPLACSVAVASTNLMFEPYHRKDVSYHDGDEELTKKDSTMFAARVKCIERQLQTNLIGASSLVTVADVRVRGAIGVIEMKKPLDQAWVTHRCKQLGVWLRPFGRLLYTMPPYITTKRELDKVTNAMLTIADESLSNMQHYVT